MNTKNWLGKGKRKCEKLYMATFELLIILKMFSPIVLLGNGWLEYKIVITFR